MSDINEFDQDYIDQDEEYRNETAELLDMFEERE